MVESADKKLNLELFSDRIENSEGNEKILDTHIFPLSHNVFYKRPGSLEVGIVC